jgi:hypothetical protein
MAPLGLGSSSASGSDGKGGLRGSADDAVQLTIDYVKQETLGPLKGLGRLLAWGVGGAFLIGVGVLLALIGVLRVLQDETGSALNGDWSWVPYVGVSGLGLMVIGAAVWRITAGPGERKLPKVEAARQGDTGGSSGSSSGSNDS